MPCNRTGEMFNQILCSAWDAKSKNFPQPNNVAIFRYACEHAWYICCCHIRLSNELGWRSGECITILYLYFYLFFVLFCSLEHWNDMVWKTASHWNGMCVCVCVHLYTFAFLCAIFYCLMPRFTFSWFLVCHRDWKWCSRCEEKSKRHGGETDRKRAMKWMH